MRTISRRSIDGADGGILLSAHVETEIFAPMCDAAEAGERDAALARWQSVAELTRLLFAEPSPAPAKYWLWRTGLIDSAEVRLPMVEVSAPLAARLDVEIDRRIPVIAGSRRRCAYKCGRMTGSAAKPSSGLLIGEHRK